MDTFIHQHFLKLRQLPEKAVALFRGAETEHLFHHAAVIPGPVKQGDFATGRQMLDIALEIPLRCLAVRGFGQRNHPRHPWIKIFAYPFDRTAFSGGIAPLEHHGDTGFGGFDPGLELHQLDLQRGHGRLVFLAPHAFLIWIAGRQNILFTAFKNCLTHRVRRGFFKEF